MCREKPAQDRLAANLLAVSLLLPLKTFASHPDSAVSVGMPVNISLTAAAAFPRLQRLELLEKLLAILLKPLSNEPSPRSSITYQHGTQQDFCQEGQHEGHCDK
mmetsp:Transcript_89139/g.157772  ORF Transcript_89139/g.157772 Transcript_89139/m.157772 type:complete len:104 (-) Transcript_89139:592-903(-)